MESPEKGSIEGQGEKTGIIQDGGFKAVFWPRGRDCSRKRRNLQLPAGKRGKRLCRTGFPARLTGTYRGFELLRGDTVSL
jgi:hypothetical protein